MKLKTLILALAALALLAIAASDVSATSYPWYGDWNAGYGDCIGCAGRYNPYSPTTHDTQFAYTYGHSGWGWHKIHYDNKYTYEYPYYRHYRSYGWRYPYAYNYYPSPMYRIPLHTARGWYPGYGPGILW